MWFYRRLLRSTFPQKKSSSESEGWRGPVGPVTFIASRIESRIEITTKKRGGNFQKGEKFLGILVVRNLWTNWMIRFQQHYYFSNISGDFFPGNNKTKSAKRVMFGRFFLVILQVQKNKNRTTKAEAENAQWLTASSSLVQTCTTLIGSMYGIFTYIYHTNQLSI